MISNLTIEKVRNAHTLTHYSCPSKSLTHVNRDTHTNVYHYVICNCPKLKNSTEKKMGKS